MTHIPSHGLNDTLERVIFYRRYANYQGGISWKTKRSVLKLQSYNESYDYQIGNDTLTVLNADTGDIIARRS